MDSERVIYIMIAICVLFLFLSIFGNAFKSIIKIALRSIAGTTAIIAANYALASTGFFIGVNLFTALTIGILGIPGFFALYAAGLILK